jgi:hypothetical protein
MAGRAVLLTADLANGVAILRKAERTPLAALYNGVGNKKV